MRIYTIYLAGQISENSETYKWRERVINNLKDYKNIEIINPCNSEFNKELLKDKNLFKDWPKTTVTNLLPPKDRNYVKISDIIIANLNHYTVEKPLIGTLFELAWAYDGPDKMVIGIYSGNPNDFIVTHPFIRNTVNIFVPDEDIACNIIKNMLD